MEIMKTEEGTEIIFALAGRLETTTAPQLEQEYHDLPASVTKLTLDMAELRYVSSAGLRVILKLEKKMKKQGGMVVSNVSPMIMEVFELTGFASVLTFI